MPEHSGVELLTPECSGVDSEEISTPEHNIVTSEYEIPVNECSEDFSNINLTLKHNLGEFFESHANIV